MKIAQVVSTFPPYKGGMGNVVFHHSWELALLGHEITVFTPHYKNREEKFKDFRIKSVVPWVKYGNGAFLPQLYWAVQGFDIVHLHYPFFGGDLPIYLLKIFKPEKTKLVLTYHMDTLGKSWLGRYFKFHAKHLTPRLLKSADKIIVTSMDYARNSNIGKFVDERPDKFIEVPLGADTRIFKPQEKDKELLEKYGITPEQKTILFVSALDKQHYFKGLDNLLEAVARLNLSVKLLIIGRGSLTPYYQKKAEELGIGDKVHFVGYVSDFDLSKYYNICDLFVLPSTDRSEAFGLVYTEAMACAKPVVASDLPGVRTVVDDGANGYLVEPQNIKQLADKISSILKNDKKAEKFGQAGLTKVKEKYNWQDSAREIERVYKSIIRKE